MTATLLGAALAVLAAPFLAACGYLALLAAAARRPRVPAEREPRTRIAVLVPAHDEEAGLPATLRSLFAADYPRARLEVVVVADNCTDRTAAVALREGAQVLVRDDPDRRGKGHALAFGFATLLDRGWAEAVVVVDADTLVSPNLLRAMEARLAEGASAVQVAYGVREPESGWRAALAAVAFFAFHDLRSLGRERLGLSCGLRGNGMAFAARVLREVPYAAFSLVEDVEHGIALARGGHRVAFAPEASVRGFVPTGARAAADQRRRWEAGRRALASALARPLLVEALKRRDPVRLDLALDLVVPPIATLALGVAGGGAAALVLASATGNAAPVLPWTLAAAGLAFHVGRAWWLSGSGLAGLRALLWAPVYVAWKVGLRLRARRTREWVRTARRGEA